MYFIMLKAEKISLSASYSIQSFEIARYEYLELLRERERAEDFKDSRDFADP